MSLAPPTLRLFLVAGLVPLVICAPAQALVTFDDSHDHIYVGASFGVSHDSNVFASKGGQGDFVYNSGVTADYTRRAGWIGVNAAVSVAAGHYGKLRGEDFANPNFNMELTKQSGRTTGSFTLSAARESRADPAVNMRLTSWNYVWGLNFKYPINGTYDLAGTFGYNQRKYQDQSAFANLATYSASIDLFHVLTEERDVLLGYRYRYSDTTKNTAFIDQSVSTGLTGKLIRGFNGGLRFGYQVRTPTGASVDKNKFSSWTASASTSYNVSKKLGFTASISKDFSTTAVSTSVDALSLALGAQYTFSNHWAFAANVSGGYSKFLGESGRIVRDPGPPAIFGAARLDEFVTGDLSVNYSLNEHLKLALDYNQYFNWSNTPIANFSRSAWSFNASTHW